MQAPLFLSLTLSLLSTLSTTQSLSEHAHHNTRRVYVSRWQKNAVGPIDHCVFLFHWHFYRAAVRWWLHCQPKHSESHICRCFGINNKCGRCCAGIRNVAAWIYTFLINKSILGLCIMFGTYAIWWWFHLLGHHILFVFYWWCIVFLRKKKQYNCYPWDGKSKRIIIFQKSDPEIVWNFGA